MKLQVELPPRAVLKFARILPSTLLPLTTPEIVDLEVISILGSRPHAAKDDIRIITIPRNDRRSIKKVL